MSKRKRNNHRSSQKQIPISFEETRNRIDIINSALTSNHAGSYSELINLARSVGYMPQNRNGHQVFISPSGNLVRKINGSVFGVSHAKGNMPTGTYRDALKAIKLSLQDYLAYYC